MRYFYLLIFSCFTLFKLEAQIDTSFWFVAPQVPSAIGVTTIGLQISSYSQSVTIKVRQPANLSGVNFSLTLPANTSTVIDITSQQALYTSTLANASDIKGLYISTSDLTSINYIIGSNIGKESISLKGRNAIGTDFYTPFPNTINSLATASALATGSVSGNIAFDVIATESGVTTLVITPRGNLVGPRTKNVTFVKTLNQGETFSCQETVKSNRSPRSVVTGNFNGDAFPDMAIVDDLSSLVFVFTGNGTGGFSEVGTYTLGSAPTKVISADVNNDANMDIIVTNSVSNNVSVILGNGNGTFQTPTTFNSGGSAPVSAVCVDVNADGNKDIILSNSSSNNVSVHLGNGAGTFAFSANYAAGTNPSDIVSSDFNNDGRPDLAVTNFGSNNLTVLSGAVVLGTFNFSVTLGVGNGPSAVVVGDFNNDGFEDLAVACRSSNRVGLLRANTTNFAAVVYFAVGVQPVSLVAANVDAGANLDIVVANINTNNTSVLIGNGAASFAAAYNLNMVGSNPASIAFGDFNADAVQDFVIANYMSSNFTMHFGTGATAMSPISSHGFGYTQPFATELAGSIIAADKKIAITLKGAIGNSALCPSFYTDQITNSSKIGLDHVIHQSNSSNDIAYIFAPVNSTSLSITSATTTNWLINSGETFTVNTSANNLTYIKSDKPVYVYNLAGNGCKLGGAQIAPAYCAGSYTAGFTRPSSDSLYLQVYIRNGYQNTFTLDVNSVPQSVPASNFTVVPGSTNSLVAARIYYNTATIPVGAYCVLKNSADLFGFSTQNSSNASGNSFSQHTNFSSDPFVFANVVPTGTICSNTTFTLNGQIGGGPNTGVWSTNGYGTFSGGLYQISNNVYTPSQLDTTLKPVPNPMSLTGGTVNLVLTSTGICPNVSHTFSLAVRQEPIVNTGANQVKCTNNPTVQLSATIIGASTQGTWSAVAPANGTFGNTSSLVTTYTPSSSDTSQAYINLVLTSINNGFCSAGRDTVKVTFQKAPLVKASSTPTLTRCTNNQTVTLNGYISSNIVSGIWSTSGSGIFVPNNISLTNNYLPSLADMTSSPIKLKLTTPPSALCKDVSDSVYVYFVNPATISAGVDLNSCKNNPIVPLNSIITGTTSSTGLWSGGSGTFVPSNSVLSPTYLATSTETASGFVILTVVTTSNSSGCLASSDQIRIDFQEKPTANFTFSNVCLGKATQYTDQSVNTSGQGALSGWQWTFGNGNTSTNLNPSESFTTAGTYTTQLVVNNTFNCFDTIMKSVVVFPLPNVKLGISRSCTGSSQNICFSDSSTIAPPSNIPSTGYYWDFGGVGFSITKDTCFVFPTEGKYSITHQVTSNQGCLSSVVQTLNITPKPKAKFLFINSTGLSVGANIQFVDSSSNSVSWAWSFGNGNFSNIQNPSSFYGENGTYTVSQTVADQFGCTDTYTAPVRVLNIVTEITELIPNIITPNNDGKNDFWRLDFIDIYYPKAEIEIFNRWGESIFRSTGYANAWDGSYKGDPLPVGAYYYTLDLKDPKKPAVIKGNITLLK